MHRLCSTAHVRCYGLCFSRLARNRSSVHKINRFVASAKSLRVRLLSRIPRADSAGHPEFNAASSPLAASGCKNLSTSAQQALCTARRAKRLSLLYVQHSHVVQRCGARKPAHKNNSVQQQCEQLLPKCVSYWTTGWTMKLALLWVHLQNARCHRYCGGVAAETSCIQHVSLLS